RAIVQFHTARPKNDVLIAAIVGKQTQLRTGKSQVNEIGVAIDLQTKNTGRKRHGSIGIAEMVIHKLLADMGGEKSLQRRAERMFGRIFRGPARYVVTPSEDLVWPG